MILSCLTILTQNSYYEKVTGILIFVKFCNISKNSRRLQRKSNFRENFRKKKTKIKRKIGRKYNGYNEVLLSCIRCPNKPFLNTTHLIFFDNTKINMPLDIFYSYGNWTSF